MSHYDEIAQKYEEYYYHTLKEGYPIRFQNIGRIVEKASVVRPKRMIDLCGASGILTPLLKDALQLDDAIVVDNSEGMLRVAEERGFKTAHCDMNDTSSIRALPDAIGRVDGVFIHWSIHHCTNIEKTINDLGRYVINDTGVIVVVAEKDIKFPAPDRILSEQHVRYRNTVLALDRVPEEGHLSMHKEWFETGQPFRVNSEKYEENVRGHFMSWLHTATEAEVEQFLKEIRAKEIIEIANHDFVYVYQRS